MQSHDDNLTIQHEFNQVLAYIKPNAFDGSSRPWNEVANRHIDRIKNGYQLKKSDAEIFFSDPKIQEIFSQTPYEHRTIVEFGIQFGGWAQHILREEWKIIGYDFAETALNYLKENCSKIFIREIDLNSLSSDHTQLSYQQELELDLATSMNVVAIHVLEHLNENSLRLLLFKLMNYAQQGTTFYIEHWAHDLKINREDNSVLKKHKACLIDAYQGNGILKKNYIISFFSPRTDIQIKNHTLDYLRNVNSDGYATKYNSLYNEKIVLRKI